MDPAQQLDPGRPIQVRLTEAAAQLEILGLEGPLPIARELSPPKALQNSIQGGPQGVIIGAQPGGLGHDPLPDLSGGRTIAALDGSLVLGEEAGRQPAEVVRAQAMTLQLNLQLSLLGLGTFWRHGG